MKTIERKSMLYKTGVEYGDYTSNHVQGCSHGCEYPCYAFLMAKRFGKVKSYEEWIEPAIVSNTLDLLDKEIPKLRDKIESVQLCFTTDPFMYGYQEIEAMSLAAIKKLNHAGVSCSILTKGVLPSALAELPAINMFGITLISLDENFRRKIEPGAATYSERIEALKKLHELGCKTWISIEPYPTPNIIKQDLVPILETVAFVDRIVFGRTNYNKVVSQYKDHKAFYDRQAAIVMQFCESHKIDCYIKKGTLTQLEKISNEAAETQNTTVRALAV